MSNATVQGAYSKKIITSAAIAATTNTTFTLPRDTTCAVFFFQTSSSSGTSPTLDLNIQTSPDGGTTYFTVQRCAQLTGDTIVRLILNPYGGAGNTATTVTNAGGGNYAAIATTGGALSTGCPVDFDYMRISAVVGGTNPSFTLVGFVTCMLQRQMLSSS